MKKIGIITSGGDAPGMNAAIRAIVRTCVYNDIEVYGIKQGYFGLLKGEIEQMDIASVADIIQKGGTMLRSARCEEFTTEEGFKKGINVLEMFDLDGLVVLGGDGTFKGAEKISKAGIPVIGIPCTIDNDMGYTDYTVGFYTAIGTVIDAIGKIRDTSTSHGRANVVEVMGRNCGDIALYSGVAGGAESIIVPEVEYNISEVCKRVIQGRNRGKLHHIIVLAEGVGNAYEVAEEIESKTDTETRVTVLGHIQRGGSPVAFDRIMASEMGHKAVNLLMEGKSGRALGIKCDQIFDMDITEAVETKRVFNKDMYEMAKVLSI